MILEGIYFGATFFERHGTQPSGITTLFGRHALITNRQRQFAYCFGIARVAGRVERVHAAKREGYYANDAG